MLISSATQYRSLQQTPPSQPAPPSDKPQPPAEKPWSELQKAATMLDNGKDVVHIDGVRWDIENAADGQCIEKGVFSDAKFQPEKVKDVYLCIKPFVDQPMNFPGHALLSFEFEPDAPVTNSKGETDTSLVVSVEAHFRQGEPWDPNMESPVMHQVGTWNDALEKANLYDHDPLQRYKMKLSHEEKVALLRDRVGAAVQNHDKDMYDAITNSCLSNVVDGVNKIVPEHKQIPKTQPDGSPDPGATVPIWCPNTFLAHDLLADRKPTTFPAIPAPEPAPEPKPQPNQLLMQW